MPIRGLKTSSSLIFALSPELRQRLGIWRAEQDTMVFYEQVATGGFRSKQKLSASVWQMAKDLFNAGEISPYYGASGGGYTYHFLPSPVISTIRLSNGFTEEFLEVQEQSTFNRETWFHRLIQAVVPGTSSALIPAEWQTFAITEKEYETLLAWRCWNELACFSSRYIYDFSITTLGVVIRVSDTRTKEVIDVTNYTDW